MVQEGEALARTLTLLGYKLKFFFGPALRGRFGPLLLIVFIIIFTPSGIGLAMGLGQLVKGSDPQAALNFLATPLAAGLSLAFLLGLFGGVTAHVSEFDFFMTAPVRPREYLAADLLFQLASMAGTGGLAAVVAAVALVTTVGRSLILVPALLALLLAYVVFALMIMQVLVVLGIKHPGWGLRGAILGLILISLLPSLSLVGPAIPFGFNSLPFPSTVFASLAFALLRGAAPGSIDLGLGLGYVALGGLAWFALSDTYIFHGLKPLLSVGFGQMSATYNLEKERRMIRGLGGLTKGLKLRPDRGGETLFMSSLHVIRSLRDGSLLFVGLYLVIASTPAALGGGGLPGTTIVTGLLAIPIAILAMNWAFYERENLWIILTSARSPRAYFRGLMVSLAAAGLVVAGAAIAVLAVATSGSLTVDQVANPLAGSVTAALAATAMVIRFKLSPGGFSPAIPALLIVVSFMGFLGGLAAQGLLLAAHATLGLGVGVQAGLLVIFLGGLMLGSLRGIDRLAKSFQL